MPDAGSKLDIIQAQGIDDFGIPAIPAVLIYDPDKQAEPLKLFDLSEAVLLAGLISGAAATPTRLSPWVVPEQGALLLLASRGLGLLIYARRKRNHCWLTHAANPDVQQSIPAALDSTVGWWRRRRKM